MPQQRNLPAPSAAFLPIAEIFKRIYFQTMNMKFKSVRLVVAAAFASLLWAGCASERTYYSDATPESQPVDLTKRRADTHPESRTGLDQYAGQDTVIEAPAAIEEAAGAQRRP